MFMVCQFKSSNGDKGVNKIMCAREGFKLDIAEKGGEDLNVHNERERLFKCME